MIVIDQSFKQYRDNVFIDEYHEGRQFFSISFCILCHTFFSIRIYFICSLIKLHLQNEDLPQLDDMEPTVHKWK